MPFPRCQPFDRFTWRRAINPKMSARIEPIHHTQTMPSTIEAMANPFHGRLA
jgi:hypothetical protein